MITKDIGINETGDGGDIAIINNDIALSDQLYQQAYLAMFGGNIEADTLGNELPSQIRLDWWANSLLFSKVPNKQFNSKTERALMDNPLTSTGRVNIQRAVETDLAYLKTVATLKVDVSITGRNGLSITIQLTQPGGQQSTTLQVLWDNNKNEVIINKII